MSKTYSIACKTCRKSLWIAQKSTGAAHMYTRPAKIRKLCDFLFEHEMHDLVFGENCETYISEFEEIDDEE